MQNLEHAHHWASSWNCSGEIGAAVYFAGMTAQQANAFVENPDKGTFERIMARAHDEAARAQSYYDAKDPYLRFRDIKHRPGETFEQFTSGTQTARPGATASTGKQSRKPNEPELRHELHEAIEARTRADARAKLASEAEGRALAALEEAQTEVDRLEAQQQQASQAATERHARAAAEALRAGAPLPAASPAPESPNAASLAAARAQRDALEAAHAKLAAETKQAAGEANIASDAVAAATDALLAFEAKGNLGAAVVPLKHLMGKGNLLSYAVVFLMIALVAAAFVILLFV
ncbi:MAG: hypothetical protein ACLP1W_14105 [Rhodomicrobium sp.]